MTQYKYTVKGKVRYGRHKDDGGHGWVVIDCPSDIVYYYNRVCNWLLHKDRKITRPLHGAHITVVAGKHQDVDKSLWNIQNGEEFEFSYGQIQDNGQNYFWLPVKCEQACELRRSLGLTPYPKFQFHLTVGYLND